MYNVLNNLFVLTIECIWFLVPVYVANVLPVFVREIRFLETPVDFGIRIKGKPLFGEHKTYRGFFFGIIGAFVVIYIQAYMAKLGYKLSFYAYDSNILELGFLMGFGSLLGDLIKSFFKRRMGIKPGRVWFPFDHLDYIVGALAFIILIVPLSFSLIIWMIIVSFVIHIIGNIIGYVLGLKSLR